MFIVLLRFSDNQSKAPEFMAGHNEWIKHGMDDKVFILCGSLQPGPGGVVMAHNTTLPELQSRVNEDPFVENNVVTAEILEVTPSATEERLNFLIN